MQTTYRWYSIKMMGKAIPSSLLTERLKSFHSEDCWFAYVSGDDSDDLRFFKRSELLVEQYDARGNQTFSKVESVTATTIALLESRTRTLLRVVNPGRSVQALIMAFEKVMGFGFSSKAVTFESLNPESLLQRVDVSKLVGLKVTNVVVGPDCVGRMEFASKEGMIASRMPLLKGLKFKQDYVKYELLHKGIRGHMILSANGTAKIGGALSPLILKMIERDVSRIS